MIQFFRYARHADIIRLEGEGWKVVADLGDSHRCYAVLCEYPEIWKPIAGYEGIYEVSSHGVVRSIDRVIYRPQAKTGHPRNLKGRVLRTNLVGSGYHAVHLYDEKAQQRGRYVAHLVAEAFIGPRPDGAEVCHSDGDKNNNAGFNLRYGTRIENEADKVLHGTLLVGEKCPASKLKECDVAYIRSARGTVRQKDLASLYGITQSNVSMIQSGTTWAENKP